MSITFYLAGSYVLSNFSAHAVEYDGRIYPTAEHAYQAAKFEDAVIKQKICEARSPMLAKKLANETYRKDRYPDWNDKKAGVMEEILRTKLGQHEEVADMLKQTGTQEIAETSPVDDFWGKGQDGTGQNMLGILWMQLRSELIQA
jgi:ribA/ribD-fused uncharacterized protein